MRWWYMTMVHIRKSFTWIMCVRFIVVVNTIALMIVSCCEHAAEFFCRDDLILLESIVVDHGAEESEIAHELVLK